MASTPSPEVVRVRPGPTSTAWLIGRIRELQAGDPLNPVGVHLHFSIVRDDGSGHFTNELENANTLDPSPYFGLNLNANSNTGEIPLCK